MNLLLYSEEKEHFTRLMRERLRERKNWRCLSLEDFRRRLSLTERISQRTTERTWECDGVVIANGSLVLDRVFSCGGGLSDQTHAFEMLSFLHYLRKSSPRHLSTVMHADPMEWCLPLVSQWELARVTLPEIQVPSYVFPAGPDIPEDQWVITRYSDRLNWRAGRHTSEPAALAFTRPRGKPVLVIATPNGHMECPDARAGELARRICAAWGLWFAEVLLFADGDRLTFGMVNVQPSKAVDGSELARFFDSQLEGVGA